MVVAIGVALLVAVGASTAGADSSVMYGSSNPAAGGGTGPATLVTVNLSTGVATAVGTLPFPDGVQEIVCQPHAASAAAAICYAQETGNFASIGTISQFNLATGAPIGSPVNDGTLFPGLAYVGTTLYGTSFAGFMNDPSFLQILNPTTGVPTMIGPTGVSHPMTGMAYDGTTMYGISGGGSSANSSLYTINTHDRACHVGRCHGHTLGSLQFGPDGTLYAGGDDSNGGHLYRLDKTTGAAALVGASGFPNLTGLALVTFTTTTTTTTTAPAPVVVTPKFTG